MLSSQRSHFDAMYAADPDPWGYRLSWYEHRRYALLTAMLHKPTYERGFEPGCSNGTLTSALALRCTTLQAWDGSNEAVQLTRDACLEYPHVSVHHCSVPRHWPTGSFDLIVLADFLYYLPPADIHEVLARTAGSAQAGCMVLAGHWRGLADDFATAGGDAVHAILDDVLGPPNVGHYHDADQIVSGWTL